MDFTLTENLDHINFNNRSIVDLSSVEILNEQPIKIFFYLINLFYF